MPSYHLDGSAAPSERLMMSQYSALSTDEQSSAGGHACDADKLQALKAELQHERRRTAELRAELGVSRHAREGHQVPAEGGTLAFDERTGSAGHRNGGDGSDSDTGSGRQEDGAREPRASPPVATGQARDVSLELSAAAGEGDPGSGQTASQQSVLRSQCREGSRLHCCMNMARDFLGDGQPGPSLEAENRPQQIVTELSGHLDRVKYACFFDGGTKAVSCADDNTLRVWDLVSSCCIGVLGVPKVQGEPSGVDDVEALATSEVEAEEGSPKPRQGSGVDYNSAYVDVNRRLQSVLEVKSCGPFDLRETKIPELQWGERKYSLHGRTGKLSGEPVEVSLGRIQRRARGIPDSATHFIYAYQADDGPAAEEGSKVGAEDEALLALGGFIYLQKTGDPWKAVHALGIETRPGASKLHFRKSPHYLKAAWLREKMTARQFRKVNILALNKQGAHWYCWVSPGEDIWQDGAVSDTHGGFVYLSDRLDLEAASNDKDIDELSKSHSDSCYFEMASGHWHWVRSCRALKDNKSILSCSADGTLRMWDIPTGRCELIMTGHKDWVMECDIFDDESRVVSCSSDKTLRVWNLIDGSEQKHMTGHKEWVMCCSAYRHREGWRAVSSSRDTTLGVWSLDSGSDWLYWLKGHTDWVGCCRVFEHADGWKALSCSNDKELRVWNLSSCESKRDPEQQISHESGQQDESELVLKGHKDIAIGCDAFSIDGKWQAVSCSADNSIHFWNLSSEDTDIAGANGQSVRKPLRTFSTAHRVRGVCVTTDGTKILSCSADHKVRLWDLELLRDKEGLVAQLDETVESEVWHNEGRKMMWRLWPHMAVNRHRLWTFRLLQGIHSISSMELETLLYERDANGKTFIHQLASTEDGGFVLAKLLESYQDERQHARDGTEATESLLRRSQAEATMGLMRRSTTYASEEKTVLKTALEQGNKIMIQTLLDDHCLAVAAIKRQDHYLQQTDLRPRYRDCFKALRSVELADVFDKFPDLAFRFLNELKLPHSYNHYIAVDELSESFVEQLPKDLREKIQTVQKKEAPNQLAIECSPVPLVFVKVKPQEECCGAMTFLDKYITTGRGQRTYLPFSKLLESAVEYVEANMAEQEDVVDLFNAPVLQVIIQHKWHTCGSIFSTQIVGYVIYIVALTVILLYNGRIELGQARCADHDGFACPLVPLAVPICIVYTVLLWKWEVVHQLCYSGPWEYAKDPWNWLDLSGAVLATWALGLQLIESDANQDELIQAQNLDMIQALSGFFRWLKIVYFMRGMPQTAHLVRTLIRIVFNMKWFVLLWMIFVVSFSFAFFLLLRDPRHEDINNEFSSYQSSVLTVYGMVFGAFELEWFHQAPYAKKIAVGLFMIFMIVLPTVMFNALIALMSDTWTDCERNRQANCLMEEAKLILELESLFLPSTRQEEEEHPFLVGSYTLAPKGHHNDDKEGHQIMRWHNRAYHPRWCQRIKRWFQVLLTFKIAPNMSEKATLLFVVQQQPKGRKEDSDREGKRTACGASP